LKLGPQRSARLGSTFAYPGQEDSPLENNDPRKPGLAQPNHSQPNRRSFIDYLLGTSAVATLGAIVYPIFKFMSPPQVIESAENSVVAAKLSEVPPNSGKIFKFGNKPGILVHTASGEFKAFSAVCTHLECIVQYRSETKQIWCACHNGQYNLSGKNVGGPPPRPLDEYKVNTRGDDVVVTRS
jgi:cytochrome b6-f complex iron-sulfur subunit